MVYGSVPLCLLRWETVWLIIYRVCSCVNASTILYMYTSMFNTSVLLSTESATGYKRLWFCYNWLSSDLVHRKPCWQVSVLTTIIILLFASLYLFRPHLLSRMAFLYTVTFGSRLLKEPLKGYPVSIFVLCTLQANCKKWGLCIFKNPVNICNAYNT